MRPYIGVVFEGSHMGFCVEARNDATMERATLRRFTPTETSDDAAQYIIAEQYAQDVARVLELSVTLPRIVR